MSLWEVVAKQYMEELSVIKKAPIAWLIASIGLAAIWVSAYHINMSMIITWFQTFNATR